jgi:hypothetical protein
MRSIRRGSNGLGIRYSEGELRETVGAGGHVAALVARQPGDGVHRGHFHLARDGGGADVERPPEDEWKAQDVVDLVRIVGAPGRDHRIAADRADLVGQDLRGRVGQREHQRAGGHFRDLRRRQHLTGRQPEEDVGAGDHVGQRARRGRLRVARLFRVHQHRAALVHDALDVGDDDVRAGQPELDQQVQAGECRSSRAAAHEPGVLDALFHDLQAVQHRRADDDGGAVLIVVEDRYLHPLAQPALDGEALRGLDVLQVDAAEGRLQRRDDFDQPVRIALVDLEIEHVDAGEFLEQDRLAFHHRLGRERPDRPQAEHRRAVGDDADQVGARGEARGAGRVGGDRLARRRHAGRVRQRQIALVGQLLGRVDRDLPGTGKLVIVEGRAAKVRVLLIRHWSSP